MSRLIKKHDSISKRIILLASTTICLCTLLLGGFIIWHFEKSQQRMLDTYLLAYIDSLIAVTKLDANDNVVVSNHIELFANMPFYWQISINSKVIKSSTLTVSENIRITKKEFLFPNNQKVTYKIGLRKETIKALERERWNNFIEPLTVIFITMAFLFISVLAILQIIAIIRPLNQIKSEIINIHRGNKKMLEHTYPKEIKTLAYEINTLIQHNLLTIERYRIFAANLSHAIKTPLTIVNNEAQKSSGKLSKIAQEKTADILALVDRNLTRVQASNNNTFISKKIEVVALIQKISDGFGKLYKKNIQINDISAISFFYANEPDLFEVFGHLIENACKYSRKNVKITISNSSKHIIITIEDDGDGIPKNKINSVFDHGTRLDQTIPGHGIGLAVVYEIVSLYQGNIQLGKSDMRGLRVDIILNLNTPELK